MSRRVEVFLLILILAGALVLRVYDLRGAPPGAQHDEVFSANFATQILDGAHPVYWDQNGGVMALHSYLVALAFAVFGTLRSIVVTLRMVSVVCGLATIVFTYLAARQLFGVGVALFAAALMSVSQWHLFESRVGLEPVTLMLMASVTAWGFVRATADIRRRTADGGRRLTDEGDKGRLGEIGGNRGKLREIGRNKEQSGSGNDAVVDEGRQGPSAVRRAIADVWVGLALGLTMYTYQPGPLVGLALLAFAGYLFVWHREIFRERWRSFARMFAAAVIVAAPLAYHLMTTEGDASSRVEDLSLDLRAAVEGDVGPLANNVRGVLGMLVFSGDPSYRYNLPGRPVFTLGVGVLAYLGLLLSLWRWREPRFAFVVIWLACTVLASAVTRASPSYLRSSAALPLIVMLPGMAIADFRLLIVDWFSKISRGKGQGARGIEPVGNRNMQFAMRSSQFALVAMAIGLVGWEAASSVQDYFGNWANLERVRTTYRADLAETAEFLDTQKPAGIVMLSARYPSDLDQGALYLLQQKQRQTYRWFNGRRVLVLPYDPANQGAAYFIPASNASAGDGAALLQTLRAETGPLDEHGTAPFTLYSLPASELAQLRSRAPQIPIHADAGNEVELIGVDTNLNGRTLHVLLYWQIVHRVPGDRDRSFFTHLVDANGKLLAQQDNSAYPTSSWHDGDVVWQWYDLQLPADFPQGDTWLELGVYDANAPGQPRVPIIGADGKIVEDHVRVRVVSR